MLSPPTKTKVEVNDEGSLHSFSICMHDMKNLQNKCEWIAGTSVVLVWTLTLKNKIESPLPASVPRSLFFRWNIGTDHDLAVYIIINE